MVEAASWAFSTHVAMDAGYSAMLAASDGNIYTALCTHDGRNDAILVRYEPSAGETRIFADMGEVTGEKGNYAIPQGKIHTRMAEDANGGIWFATHPTYPAGPVPLDAPSGHVIVFDPRSGICRSIARAPARQAIITAAFSEARNTMVALSNPSGHLLRYDLNTGSMEDLGEVTNGGSPCRSIGIDGDGIAWFTREPGEIVGLPPDGTELIVASARMPHPEIPGEVGMGVWRTITWDDSGGLFYAVHARTSFLFSFDPRRDVTTPIGLVSAESEHGDPRATFASLAFAQAPDRKIHTVAPRGIFDFFNSRPLRGAAQLVSFNPLTGGISDHGPILSVDGRRVWGSQNAVVSRDGKELYVLGVVEIFADELTGEIPQIAIETTDGEVARVGYQLRVLAIDLTTLDAE